MKSAEIDADAERVARALRDRHAYGEIVRRFEAVLMRYVRRLLGPHAQHAEDVVQDAFVKAYVNLNSYDRNRSLAPWLYRIAHNGAISYLRKRGTGPLMISGEDGWLLLERIAADEQSMAGTDIDAEARGIGQAVSQLHPRYREVIALRYLEERSYDEIADILHLPPGTVATRIRRGLLELKSFYTSNAGSEIDGHA